MENLKSEKTKNKKENNVVLYSIIIALLVIIIGLAIYIINLNNTHNKEINNLKLQISTLNNKNTKLEQEKMDEWIGKIKNSSKAEFLDENIVFVIDGYGKYYYTYDQMKQVTQGTEYSYWAYNKEQAIANGYKAWK